MWRPKPPQVGTPADHRRGTRRHSQYDQWLGRCHAVPDYPTPYPTPYVALCVALCVAPCDRSATDSHPGTALTADPLPIRTQSATITVGGQIVLTNPEIETSTAVDVT